MTIDKKVSSKKYTKKSNKYFPCGVKIAEYIDLSLVTLSISFVIRGCKNFLISLPCSLINPLLDKGQIKEVCITIYIWVFLINIPQLIIKK